MSPAGSLVAPGLREHTGGGALHWQLCDEARRNPIGPAALAWIAERCTTLRGELVVLEGAGTRVFCAGFDLAALAEREGGEPPDLPLARAVAAIGAADATFVAVLRGHAIGAGVELACACDLRVARRGIAFEIPAARLGVVYRAEGLALLQQVFGGALTRRLVLLGERLEVELAHAHGAIDVMVDEAELDDAAARVLAALRRGDPDALRGNRTLLRSLRVEAPAALLAEHAARRDRAFVGAAARLRERAAKPEPPASSEPAPVLLGSRPMAIREEIEGRVKQARRDKDERTLNVIGMLKNRVLVELKSGSGAEDNDELWRSVIAAYVKQLKKSIPDFQKAGERGKDALVELEWEIAFCEQFLPSKLDEAATETLVRGIVASHDLGAQGPKAMGKLMGLLMKEHKDAIDSELAKSIAQRVLAGG